MLLPSVQFNLEKSVRSEGSIRYHNLIWYQSIYLEDKVKPRDHHNTPDFILGRTYTFLYDDPKYKDELDFYSAFPISMFIGYRDDSVGNPMMLNLHFIPPKIRASVLDKIYEVNMNKIDAIERVILKDHKSYRHLNTKYGDLMHYLHKSGFGFAIRSYIPSRIKTEPKAISHRDLWRTITFANQFLQKKTANEIYRLYKSNLEGFKVFKKEPKIKL